MLCAQTLQTEAAQLPIGRFICRPDKFTAEFRAAEATACRRHHQPIR
jgi:hypothetical protein